MNEVLIPIRFYVFSCRLPTLPSSLFRTEGAPTLKGMVTGSIDGKLSKFDISNNFE
jgi:hypothetical protein